VEALCAIVHRGDDEDFWNGTYTQLVCVVELSAWSLTSWPPCCLRVKITTTVAKVTVFCAVQAKITLKSEADSPRELEL